jgi:hypothetical protein
MIQAGSAKLQTASMQCKQPSWRASGLFETSLQWG